MKSVRSGDDEMNNVDCVTSLVWPADHVIATVPNPARQLVAIESPVYVRGDTLMKTDRHCGLDLSAAAAAAAASLQRGYYCHL